MNEKVLEVLRRGKVEDFNQMNTYRVQMTDLSSGNLAGARLDHINFESVILDSVDFSRASLKHASFRSSVLRFANFEGADLRGADFEGANLYNADFTGADMRGANLKNADLYLSRLPDDIAPDEIRLSVERGMRLRSTRKDD